MAEQNRNILEEMNRYFPGISCQNTDHGIEKLVILLLGLVGQGKSSLINSCTCVVKNTGYENLSGSGNSAKGKTMRRTSYDLTDTVQITDNRGFCKMDAQEMLECCAQLRHLRPLEEVEWEKDNSKETLKRIPESYERPKEFLLPVIVHSICNRPEEEPMDTLVTKCQQITGIPPIVVLTKARSPNSGTTNPAAMKRRFADLGVVHSIALENYTENEQNRNQDADNQFLNFLDVCMKEAERGINLRQSQDYRQIFAKNVADQVKEEQELKNKQQDDSMRKLQENKGCCVQ